MPKQLTAHDLMEYLKNLTDEGHDLKRIVINYRYDYDSDVDSVFAVEEDLYDADTNATLESIVLVTEPDEDD